MKLSEYLKPIIMRGPKRRGRRSICECGRPIHAKDKCKRCYEKEYRSTPNGRQYHRSYERNILSSFFFYTDLEDGYRLMEVLRYNNNTGTVNNFSAFVRNKYRYKSRKKYVTIDVSE